MKKTLILIVCAVWLGLIVTSAGADTMLAFNDGFYLGQIMDGIPSSEAAEAGYISNLITLSAGQSNTTIGSETYNRVGSALAGLFPPVTAAELVKDEDFSGADPYTVVLASYGYILGKYDAGAAGSFVWYVPPGTYVVPEAFGSYGLSHITSSGTAVPEPGILILLGIAMSAVGIVSRYVRKI